MGSRTFCPRRIGIEPIRMIMRNVEILFIVMVLDSAFSVQR
jgi:hypothetical protein